MPFTILQCVNKDIIYNKTTAQNSKLYNFQQYIVRCNKLCDL